MKHNYAVLMSVQQFKSENIRKSVVDIVVVLNHKNNVIIAVPLLAEDVEFFSSISVLMPSFWSRSFRIMESVRIRTTTKGAGSIRAPSLLSEWC